MNSQIWRPIELSDEEKRESREARILVWRMENLRQKPGVITTERARQILWWAAIAGLGVWVVFHIHELAQGAHSIAQLAVR
jgi:hypothetical protein